MVVKVKEGQPLITAGVPMVGCWIVWNTTGMWQPCDGSCGKCVSDRGTPQPASRRMVEDGFSIVVTGPEA